jgi:hypothetical protein
MFTHLQTFPNLRQNLHQNILMSFCNLKVLKRKPQSPQKNPHVKLFKKMLLGKRFLFKIYKSSRCMKIWSNFEDKKSITIKWLRNLKKKIFTWIYHFILHHTLHHYNRCMHKWVDQFGCHASQFYLVVAITMPMLFNRF